MPGIVLAQPKITSFSPIAAKPGDVVTLAGTDFNATTANNIIFFGATRATVTAATTTNVTVTVPVGATYAPISLLNTGTGLAASSLSNFTPTFSPAKTAITATDFLPRAGFINFNEFREGSHSVAIGDLNGDGKADLAATNFGSTTVWVLPNHSVAGSIDYSSFDVWQGFVTQSRPIAIAIGDLDGDGKPDMAVANFGSNSISVFRNTSDTGGTGEVNFAAGQVFAAGTNPNSVAIGDLDGDGKPDLAVSNHNSNTVSVYRNIATTGSIGPGSFAARQDFETGENPHSVTIGDLDGDEKLDLAVANGGSNTVSVFRNISSKGSIAAGSFAAKQDFAAGNSPISLVIGDLDGDGKPDLTVANVLSDNVSVFRNTSSKGSIDAGSFAAKQDFATGRWPYSIAIGDLNGDGKPDLAAANFISNNVSVIQNTSSTGSIGPGSFAPRQDFATGAIFSIAIGDLDGDAKPDLVAGDYFSNTVSVLRNADIVYTFTGSGNWDNAANWSGGILPPSTVPAFLHIIIDPTEPGECILNVPVTVLKSSSITVAPGKKFIIQGNLTISN